MHLQSQLSWDFPRLYEFYAARILKKPYPNAYHQHQFIFIHIPKCAGKSIKAAVGVTEPMSHWSWRFYSNADKKAFQRYFKFAVVRDPLERFISAFAYLSGGGTSSYDQWACETLIRGRTIEQFVEELESSATFRWRVLNFWHFRPQVYFVTDWQGEVVVDQLISMGHLQEGIQEICRRLSLKASPIPWINKSTSTQLKLPDKVIPLIARIYQRDYRLLDFCNTEQADAAGTTKN